MRRSQNQPLGPRGTYKTGQRVPYSGLWADQYGTTSMHEENSTFPPCIGRKGECAFRKLVRLVKSA